MYLRTSDIAPLYGNLSEEKITEVVKHKLDQIHRKTWAKAIESSFDKNPELCPDCGATMIESVVFAYFAGREWRKLWKTHLLGGGYFRMKKGAQP